MSTKTPAIAAAATAATATTAARDSGLDPTANVLTIVAVAVERIDDLRAAESHRVDCAIAAERLRINEQLALRAHYDDKLIEAEAKRIDAIRSVDVAAIATANDRSVNQATVLATQVAVTAETLRSLVATSSETVQQQLRQLTTQLTDRIASLERQSYEGIGKGGGMRDMWGWVMAAVLGASTLYSIFGQHFK